MAGSSHRNLLLLGTALLLSACGKGAPGTATPPADATPTAAITPAAPPALAGALSPELSRDVQSVLLLEKTGPVTEPERQAIEDAKNKIALLQAAQATFDADKKTAADAKGVYGDKLKAYQQALAVADSARQARSKAMAALVASQKELDDSWTAVANARDAFNKALIDPKSTPDQIAAAQAALTAANARADRAAAAMTARTTELEAAQKSDQDYLGAVSTAADAASAAGTDFASKAAVAARSNAALATANASEKKAMAVIASLNQARAKVVADNLAAAAFNLAQARTNLDSARDAAKSAAGAKQSASDRLAKALSDAANARQAADNAANAAANAASLARVKADAKAAADATATQAQKAYAAAKAVLDAASSVSNKSAADAKVAARALADANARVAATAKALAAAQAADQAKSTPDTQKALAAAQAAADQAAQSQQSAQAASDAAAAKAAADATSTAQAKADADARLAVYRQAAAADATATKEKTAADADAAQAARDSARATALAAQRAADADKAKAAADAANSASEAANQRLSGATQAQADAQDRYHTAYDRNEEYRLSATQTDDQLAAEDQKLFAAALWANVPDGNYWTSLVVASVRENLPRLERARDVNDWCPGYFDATDHQRTVCWLRLLGGLVKFESDFKPGDAFHEPTGNWSVGLMSLSPKECRGYETVDLLEQPLLNLSCGIDKFASLVERDGYIAGSGSALGAAAYWSTLRAPYTQSKPDGSGVYHLGKKDQILPFTTPYRNF